jgi:hypothetical protein
MYQRFSIVSSRRSSTEHPEQPLDSGLEHAVNDERYAAHTSTKTITTIVVLRTSFWVGQDVSAAPP